MITAEDARRLAVNSEFNQEKLELERQRIERFIVEAANKGKFEVSIGTSVPVDILARLFPTFKVDYIAIGSSCDPRETPYIMLRW